MVGRIGRGQLRILLGLRLPVKATAVYNNAADGGAVPADEFGGGFHNNVCPMCNRTDQIRSAEGVVDDQRNPVFMRNRGKCIDIGDFAVRVA